MLANHRLPKQGKILAISTKRLTFKIKARLLAVCMLGLGQANNNDSQLQKQKLFLFNDFSDRFPRLPPNDRRHLDNNQVKAIL